MSNTTQVVLFALALPILVVAWWFNGERVVRRKLGAAASVPIASARPNQLVKVSGVVEPSGQALKSPLGGRACVWYRVIVEQKVSGNVWTPVLQEERSCDFTLRDRSAAARVRMREPKVASRATQSSRSGRFDDTTPVEEGFLARHGQQGTDFFGLNRVLRYHESVIEPGVRVSVLGRLRVDGAGTILIERHPESGLLVSDDAEVAPASGSG